MNNSLFSLYSNIFGFVVGGISLLGFIVTVFRPHLPSNKIKTLETLLHETEDIFNEAMEARLLIHEFIERTEHRLTVLKEHTRSLRIRVYNATTLRQDYMELLRGTSKVIGRTYQSVKNLRAEIVTSSEERRRIMQMSSEQISPLALALPSNEMTQHHPTLTASANIPRPRSCPPALSA
ncbi:hypothetical protein HD554DRAFT_2140266 [Boletus coccyginus]|nr:hypothetical protein HD554DRAFT_2140266 [Boletus coccyginus]